ncbi:MAG: metallophosphoesterase family protein [Cyclobacteriaceae bacterium]
MKIGLLSDTHSHLDENIFNYFSACDEIWHAGDIGNMELLEKLEAFKPLVAVWGNIDGHQVRAATHEAVYFEREGKKIYMIHIAGKPPGYNPRVKTMLNKYQPEILVCGHSHVLKIQKDHARNLLFINPGAAGIHGFHQVKTLVRFDINDRVISNMEVIELGKRGKLS